MARPASKVLSVAEVKAMKATLKTELTTHGVAGKTAERAIKNTSVKLRLARYSQARLDELATAEKIDYHDLHLGCLADQDATIKTAKKTLEAAQKAHDLAIKAAAKTYQAIEKANTKAAAVAAKGVAKATEGMTALQATPAGAPQKDPVAATA